MRKLFFAVAALLFSANITAAPALAHSHRHQVAPADEYFGRLKMSILGVRNQLKDLNAKLSYNPERANDVLGSALMVEDAIRDWERKYPDDSWLPKSVYLLSQLYASIHTDEGQRRAASTLAWVVQRYPQSEFAGVARSQLASVHR